MPTGNTMDVYVTLNQTGIYRIDEGALRLFGASWNTNATYHVGAGANLQFIGGSNNFTGTQTGTDSGVVYFNGGAIATPGGASFDFGGDLLQWYIGTIDATDGLTNRGRLGIYSGNDHGLIGTLTNLGTVIESDHRLFLADGAAINNEAGAVYEFQSGQLIYSGGGPESRNFNNRGTFRKSTGNGAEVYFQFNQLAGAIEILEGYRRRKAFVRELKALRLFARKRRSDHKIFVCRSRPSR